MKRWFGIIVVGAFGLSITGCAVAPVSEGDAVDENVAEAEQAQMKQPGTDRTGSQCTIVRCNGLMDPFGTCSDATCSTCHDGTHSAPGDGAQETGCVWIAYR